MTKYPQIKRPQGCESPEIWLYNRQNALTDMP